MSKPDKVAPTVTPTPEDPMSKSVERHPAYGMIGATRVSVADFSGKGHGHFLYGSDFEHRSYVNIQISEAELHRGISHDWSFGRDRLIDVALSEAQWAAFVSTLNGGDGVQCTIQEKESESVPGIAHPAPRAKQFRAEFAETFQAAMEHLEKLQDQVTNSSLSEKKKDELRRSIGMVTNNLAPDLSYIMRVFGEYMEQTTEKAKMEVNAYVQATVTRAGLKAFSSGGHEVLELAGGEEDDK